MPTSHGRTYVKDGKTFVFDAMTFRNAFNRRARESDRSIHESEESLAQALNVSSKTIHGWRMRSNSPSSIEDVAGIARELGIGVQSLLVVKDPMKAEDTMNEKYTERQLEALRRVYVSIIDYLDEFSRSDGYNDYWYKLVCKGVDKKNIEDRLYEIADNRNADLSRDLLRERFDLGKLAIYDILEEYIQEDLVDIYNGKLSYAYRFEAPVEDENGNHGESTSDDYNRALNRLEEIMAEKN